MYGDTSENPLSEGFHNFVLVLDGRSDKSPEGAAVFLGDDDFVGNVHEPPGEVTCVSSLEGGVGQTLTCSVGGDEVLEHRHTLLEVGRNRVFDNFISRST